MRLKRHETPRRRGRNAKGRAAQARLRQIRKRDRRLAAALR